MKIIHGIISAERSVFLNTQLLIREQLYLFYPVTKLSFNKICRCLDIFVIVVMFRYYRYSDDQRFVFICKDCHIFQNKVIAAAGIFPMFQRIHMFYIRNDHIRVGKNL